MEYQGTRLETDEEVRHALLRQRSPGRGLGQPVPRAAIDDAPPADDSPPLFRPTSRPATPILTVFDDGSEEGELIRIRKERFAIGRSEGDLVIPNDSQLSSRHAELRQSLSKGKHRWTLVDLKSTNGTYVRIGHAVLAHNQEFVVGATRFRFENPSANGAASAAPTPERAQSTRPWQNPAATDSMPAVVQVRSDGSGPRTVVGGSETWIGKDTAMCQIVVNDPFASARHACIRVDSDNRWVIESNKAANGLWLRVEQVHLVGTCRFLLGEQQFLFRLAK
jgi:pSer/pThr/pTyr-binding forkhead associated (FHA) protein